MKRSLLTAALAIPMLLLSAYPVIAATPKQAKVALPPFPVFLNGTPVDNTHSQYPLLIYKDITYFPMTWDYARALGLETSWDTESRLGIQKRVRSEVLVQTLTTEANTLSGETAVFPEFLIEVNGKRIENSTEPYPLLLFRNITYFPMTWRFTHDEFGWNTSWDSVNGLRIHTAASTDGTRPIAESDNYNLNNGGQLAVADDWMYLNPNSSYDGPNYLYKMKLDGSGKTRLTDDNAGSINVVGDWVYYTVVDKSKNVHQGIYKVRTDGTERTKLSDAPAGRITVDGDWIYYVDQELTGQEQYSVGFYKTKGIKKIRTDGSGESTLFQGTLSDSVSSVVTDSIHVLKDWIYFIQPGDGKHPAVLSKIRKDGSQLTPLASTGDFDTFLIAEGWIYYGTNNQLFKMMLEGSSSIPLRKFDQHVNFNTLNYHDGWLYYVKGSFGIMGSAVIEKIRIDGSEPTEVTGGVRAVNLFFAGGQLHFAGSSMGDAPLYKVTLDGKIVPLKEQ
ncbi:MULTISPECIES: DUF5050 domain-containing protein [Paenibacillus]|uniref:DUF5050 domain-containing protein n=1 Tax=Paenibacillus TaxID=44249 RepID=UPI0022B888E7|nr:DUF5050 domain-containing protein [Paenibacillus caseinilyticus]MCZ8517870.1 DUF5050 domain-containing protein [Paenibacillus caseinilyticus]